jgi:predicted ArsR family transcriptional regulator
MATLGLYRQSRETRTLGSRVLGVLERAGPLTVPELANRLGLSDEKETVVDALTELGARVAEARVWRPDYARPVKVWYVVGDSRFKTLRPAPRVAYHAEEVLTAFRRAAYRRLTRRPRRARGAG